MRVARVGGRRAWRIPAKAGAPQLTASWAAAPGGRSQAVDTPPPPAATCGALPLRRRNSLQLEFLVDLHLALRRC